MTDDNKKNQVEGNVVCEAVPMAAPPEGGGPKGRARVDLTADLELDPEDIRERADEQYLLDKYFPEGGKPDYYGLTLELSKKSGKEISDRYYEGAAAAENLIYLVKYKTFHRGNYDRLMEKIADLFISEKDSDWGNRAFQSWSHSLCHVFEHYEMNGSEGSRSLLDAKSLQPSCTRLIDEAVARTLKHRHGGCVERIVSPLIKYNIDKLEADGLDGQWPYKPESLNNTEFARIMRGDGDYQNPTMELFCLAKSPKPLLIALIKSYLSAKKDYREYNVLHSLDPKKLVAVLAKLVPADISAEEADAVVGLRYQREGLDRLSLVGNLAAAEEAKELVDAVMVDVDGTLVQMRAVMKNGDYVRDERGHSLEEEAISDNVLTLMMALEKAGRKVIVFTGGDPERQTARLAGMGLPAKYLPVLAKENYRGKLLDIMVDDTNPLIQGFKANTYYHGRAGWRGGWEKDYEITEDGKLLKKAKKDDEF